MSAFCFLVLMLYNALHPCPENLIPPEFRGEWRENLESCGDYVESALVISATEIRYLEILGEVQSVRVKGPRSITVRLRMVGPISEDRIEDFFLTRNDQQLSFSSAIGRQAWMRCPR